MFCQPLRPIRSLFGAELLCLACLISPAFGHEVQVAGDVAATFHLEPKHNPRAGESSLVWFALTRKGGELIPLADCRCRLTVYANAQATDAQATGAPVTGANPLLTPDLKAVNGDAYQGIPGAEIIFPKVGSYRLTLSGTPKSDASFQPFELSYTVTVGAGKLAPPASSPLAEGSTPSKAIKPQNEAQQPLPFLDSWELPVAGAALLGIGGVSLWAKRMKRRSP
ncbi:MAG: hypothetical protein MH252_02005 [Thermosynechococcaceae cyanobacterium MS004]|nr:hypothetical protein [Thermosynechococcaceae cyanobacterium MS004]